MEVAEELVKTMPLTGCSAVASTIDPATFHWKHLAVVLQAPGTSAKLETTRGTIYYMPPEQILGEVSSASDQYALGIIVYEWLCGKGPFDGVHGFHEMVLQHIQTPPPSLRSKVSTISPRVEQCGLSKCLAALCHKFCRDDEKLSIGSIG